jgi:hypothetical protein
MNKFLKVLVVTLCAVLLVVGSVAATLAYLTMKTAPVQNTFTAGDISITLEQTKVLNTHKMMPGMEYDVDPVVTVEKDSESCWLFIKIDKTTGFDTYLTYTLVDGWIELEPGVYYRQVAATTDAAKEFHVIAGDKVYAKDCTKDQYNALSGQPLNLDFTAYAVQRVGFDTAAAAWTEAQTLDTVETETEVDTSEGKG